MNPVRHPYGGSAINQDPCARDAASPLTHQIPDKARDFSETKKAALWHNAQDLLESIFVGASVAFRSGLDELS